MSNLLGLLGAAAIVAATAGMLGLWPAVGVAGLFLLASAYALHTQASARPDHAGDIVRGQKEA